MRFSAPIFLVGIVLVASAICRAGNHSSKSSISNSSLQRDSSQSNPSPQDCLAVAEAPKHIGKASCVTGTVVRVEQGNNGITFLDFCTDYHSCPFTVIVFRGDLKKVGDVRQLQGRVVVIQGKIEQYHDRAEIILRHPQQLGDGAKLLTALPKDYDVERQGHYSAGSARLPKAKKAKHTTQGPPVSLDDPEEP